MNCGRPDCNGVHSHSRPDAELCEGAKETMRRAQRRLRHTPGTYKYRYRRPLGPRWAQERTVYLLKERPVIEAKLVRVRAEIARLKEGVRNGRGC